MRMYLDSVAAKASAGTKDDKWRWEAELEEVVEPPPIFVHMHRIGYPERYPFDGGWYQQPHWTMLLFEACQAAVSQFNKAALSAARANASVDGT